MSDWFYALKNKQQGPVTEAALLELIAKGTVKPETLIWTAGMADWKAASTRFSFGETPPEIPGSEPAPTPWQPKSKSDTAFESVAEPEAETQVKPGLYSGAPARSFTEAVRVCFKKYVTFSGRASRSEYWYFFLFVMLGNMLFGASNALSGIWSLATVLPSLAVLWRRLHDIDRSGLWALGWIPLTLGLFTLGWLFNTPISDADIAIIAVIFAIYGIGLFVFTVTKGTPGPNRFG